MKSRNFGNGGEILNARSSCCFIALVHKAVSLSHVANYQSSSNPLNLSQSRMALGALIIPLNGCICLVKIF